MSSRKIWIGRIILSVVIVTIIATLAYLFATDEDTINPVVDAKNTAPIQKDTASVSDAAKMVEGIYGAYVKTAYDEERPNPETALQTFKKSVTMRGREALGNGAPRGKDPVLCTDGKPRALSYTEPVIVKNTDTVLIAVVSDISQGTARATVAVDRGEGKITAIACDD